MSKVNESQKMLQMDEDGLQPTQMGYLSWFAKHVQHVMDNAKKRLVMKLLMNLVDNIR